MLASSDGAAAWRALAARAPPFAVDVFVAGAAGTVCKWAGDGGIDEMKDTFPAARVREFPDAVRVVVRGGVRATVRTCARERVRAPRACV